MNRAAAVFAVVGAVACGLAPVEPDAGDAGGRGSSGGAAGATAGGAAGGGAAGGGAAGGGAAGGGAAGGGAAGGGAAGGARHPIPDGGAVVQRVDGGFQFLEGPLWLADEGALLFTDIPANRIHRYSPATGFSVFRERSGGANGLGRLADGTLLACEHGNRRVSRTLTDGGIVSLVERFDGGRFNSPNDVAVASDGTIYFSDPPYGLAGRPAELPFTGVYRRRPDGALEVLITDMTRANGVVLSPDESTLYVADSEADIFRIYRLQADGGLSSPTQVSTTQQGGSGGDGLGMDDDGNLYVTTGGAPGGGGAVKVYRPDGGYLGRIPVPQSATNVSFGGADRRTLFITAGTALYQVRLEVPGRP